MAPASTGFTVAAIFKTIFRFISALDSPVLFAGRLLSASWWASAVLISAQAVRNLIKLCIVHFHLKAGKINSYFWLILKYNRLF
jgi:hypothetical protein